MRVVIVTGRAPHQRNLCVRLAQAHQVVGILHPAEAPGGLGNAFRKLKRQVGKEGLGVVLLHALKNLPAGSAGENDVNASDAPDFTKAVAAYEQLDASLIHGSCDVKAPSTHELLRSLRPDVTVCLGGPVYPKPFIEASPLMLNFHSGLSPIYNGSASIQFAFANGHPHLCGGTLMVMSPSVDAGGILGHYLPAIRAGETPANLFQKTVAGAAVMYDRLLENLAKNPQPPVSVRQPRALFYTRGIEFGWHHRLMINRHLRANLAARCQRPEKIVEYWRSPDEAVATALYRQNIESLLWGDAGETAA